jgi:hypothetical protein
MLKITKATVKTGRKMARMGATHNLASKVKARWAEPQDLNYRVDLEDWLLGDSFQDDK